jgi:hypothetical protein
MTDSDQQQIHGRFSRFTDPEILRSST